MEIFYGRFYNGRTSRGVSVAAELSALSLEIVEANDIVHARWPLDEIHLADGSGPALRLRRGHENPARLELDDPDSLIAIKGACPNIYQSAPSLARNWRPVLLWSSLAIAGFAAILFILLPMTARIISRAIPLETEKRYSAGIAQQIIRLLESENNKNGRLICAAAPGQAAMERLMARLMPLNLGIIVEVTVLDLSVVNAFTLPGGRILLFRGMIELTETPEELAGVLGHELGHAYNRHALELAIKSAGTAALFSLLVGDVTGGAVIAGLGKMLLQTSYGRDAEREADAFALERLAAAGIDGKGVATMFDRMNAKDGASPPIFALFQTHPLTPERSATARANARPGGAAMSPEDWRAIKSMCGA